jgi:hypothetical protein
MVEIISVTCGAIGRSTLCAVKQPPTRIFGSRSTKYCRYQSLSASEKTKSKGPGSSRTSWCASPSLASMRSARPAAVKLPSASPCRPASISIVVRRPPVFERAQAIQIEE